MPYRLFHLGTLASIFGEPRLSAPDTGHTRSSRQDDGSGHHITRCAFQQTNGTSVSIFVRSDHFITFLVEEVGQELKTKSVQWFLAAGKAVECICLIHSSMWALVVTEDASLYILPVLPMVDSERWVSATSAGYSTDDITFIILKKQKQTKPTSVVFWRSQYRRCDIALVGSEEGEVVFVDLEARQEILRVRIGDAVISLDVVHHGKSLSYLMISTASSNQFGLLLEQTNSRASSLSDSMEAAASHLEFTLVRRAETVLSILGPETTDHPFRPLRFDQFMRTVQLSKQMVKGNQFIVAHCLSSNILKVYDSSLDSWLPIYVYSIPISSERVLLTDSFIFAMSKVKKQQLTSVTVLSSRLSEASMNDRDRMSSDSKLQTIVLPVGEEIVGIYRQMHPETCDPPSDRGTERTVTTGVKSGEAAHGERRVEGCIIFTKRAVFQIKPQVSFTDLFLELTAEGSTKKAEVLGMTLDLNMSLLYLRAAEGKLKQSQLPEAIKLYRLSRGSTVAWASLLAKYGYMKEALSVVESALSKQGDVSNADCRKLADIAIKCLVYLHLTHDSDQRTTLQCLDLFLADNLDYDEHAAVSLLGEFALWESMLEMAKNRGILMAAMETLFDNWLEPPDISLIEKLKSKSYLGTFVLARNGDFVNKLPKREAIQLVVSKPELVFRQMSFIQENVSQMTVPQLLQIAVLFDPTKPGTKQLFEKVQGRQRSLSLSSVVSSDSFYGLEPCPGMVVLPEASSLVQLFVYVLIELLHRRTREGYDASTEPSLTEIDTNYCSGKEETSVMSSSDIKKNLIACGQHHTALISSGELYTWGKATSGRLGHGSIIPLEGCSPPARVETLHMHHEQVVSVACGNKHTLALTSTGKLYSWGDSTYGQVGCGDRRTRTHPSVVEEIQGKGCVEITCGSYHSLARTQTGRVWSWGWGVHGQLGHGDVEDLLAPKVVGFFLGKDVVQIGAGALHSGIRTGDGKVWMFGSGAFGQLGTDACCKTTVPLLLTSLAGHTIRNFVCGYYHNLALTESDPESLYIWGKSPVEIRNNLQASRKLKAHLKKNKKSRPEHHCPKTLQTHSKPELVKTDHLLSPIKKMTASCTHNLLLTTAGSLYAWGRNDMDQLGNPGIRTKHMDTPTPVMADHNFADIGAGMNFSSAVSLYGVVYTWGSAEADQLGYSLQPHASLISSSTLLSVSAPRSVPTVPLITIPADLLHPYEEGELDEDSFSENDRKEMITPRPSTTVIDQLMSALPTPSLGLPTDNVDQLPYNKVSLLAVLEYLKEYYQLSEVLEQCERDGLWSLASQIHVMNRDFDQALVSTLKELQHNRGTLGLQEALYSLHRFFDMLSQKIHLEPKDEQHRSLQLVLSELFKFWSEHSFPVSRMESLLQRYLGLLAYPLSLLLFCSKSSPAVCGVSPLPDKVQATLSIEFCLQVTAAAMTAIEEGSSNGMSADPSQTTILGVPEYNDPSPGKPSKATNPDDLELTSEFIRSNSWFGREGLVISTEELDQASSVHQVHPLETAEAPPLKVVTFTCGHSYESQRFYEEELPKVPARFSSYSEGPTESCSILTSLYQSGSKTVPGACPQCSLESLVI